MGFKPSCVFVVIFRDREQAGMLLAQKISRQAPGTAVLGLARGGVVVASGIAHTHGLVFDVVVVKKIPSPADPELALGAVAPNGVFRVNWQMVQLVGADEPYVREQIARLSSHIKKTSTRYRNGGTSPDIRGKTVILADDGAATGATMAVAIVWARRRGAKRIIAALPVASADTVEMLRPEVGEMVVLDTPPHMGSVGQFYTDFRQVTDEEVIDLLRKGKGY